MTIDIAGHEIEQDRPDEVLPFASGIDRCVEDLVYGLGAKAPALPAVTFVFQGRSKAKRLGEILLMDPNDLIPGVQPPVETLDHQGVDAVEVDDVRLCSLEAELSRKKQCCEFQPRALQMLLARDLDDVGGGSA